MINSYKYEIADVAKGVRLEQKYSVTEVAKQTGISRETIRRIEKGLFEPRLQTIEILSSFYKVSIIEIYSDCLKSKVDYVYLKIMKYLIKEDYLSLISYSKSIYESEWVFKSCSVEIELLKIVLKIVIEFTINVNQRDANLNKLIHTKICEHLSIEKLNRQKRILSMSEAILLSLLLMTIEQKKLFDKCIKVIVEITISYSRMPLKDCALIISEKLMKHAIYQCCLKFDVQEYAMMCIINNEMDNDCSTLVKLME